MASWQTVTEQPDQLGESPFWHPHERALYWVDVPTRQLRRQAAGSPAVQSRALPAEPGCMAPARSGGLVLALRDGIYRMRRWDAALERLPLQFEHDTATQRFNDGKADPQGRFWAGTLYETKDARPSALFSIDARLGQDEGGAPRLVRQVGDAVTANGLAWSPDARTLYWADTFDHAIDAWDWNSKTNQLSGRRPFHRFLPKPPGWQPGDPGYGGRPDGAAVDVEGNYWCALFEGGRLAKLSPQGELLASIELPVRCPTMPCFGGDDGRTLFVTSARHKRPPAELAAWPLSGHVLSLRVEVPGLPVNFYID